ncbi:Cleft lip and palate transmembrane protein 1-like protein [Wickerhamomyces ciferrii]|uniref:Cleft lip and palate transmembrane protein 1-like protein n=1 Tax=Wickerhamomyces ciferrii (strain ATCC 14091 / BCRC 22168 / CBS 111 / JCM 3599 / NBRC 0793 / NRRL Y-1031 F-60-10) TaxID=1206466 RepID=K0KX86_WICCF|nr:Cleft lip and palate transmembrane protein 1-like protein [Wickerhamomyces ciferrii]CCH45693.1 Cleft lip and palate transmembrane protein 1-like protein [Wickerhamomyces ciferrii]
MPESTQQPQTEEQQAGGGGILANLKYYVLVYLAVNAFLQWTSPKKDDEGVSSSINSIADKSIAALQNYKFYPNIDNSSFINFEQPENSTMTVTTKDKDGNVTEHEIKTYEQALYENSLSPPRFLTPIAKEDDLVSYEFYVSEDPYFQRVQGDYKPVIKLDNIEISKAKSVTESFKFPISDTIKVNNGSVYLYAYIIYDNLDVIGSKQFQLSTYLPKKKEIKLHKLVGNNDEELDENVNKASEEQEEDAGEQPILSHWHPNVTIAITNFPGLLDTQNLPPSVVDIFPLDPLDRRDNLTGLVTQYFPLLYQNKFWQLKDHMNEINSTTEELELNLHIDFTRFWKIQALIVVGEGLKQQQDSPLAAASSGLSDGSEIDAVKKILLDTNPYLLAITIAVSLLHSLLEFLAFKNDISHWRNKKDNVGISVRSIVANVVQQIITLLYLLDNSEGTSFMILASQGVGILVEAWKITTVLKFEVSWNGAIPSVEISDKYKLTETEEKTKEYDSIAFKYLYWVSVPLLSAYAVYSLLYKEHKSWYSFVVTTLVGFVYTYGFLTLVPSVYINYRLKSVAHIPKKAMAYKFVNTFIDDLFAFVIKMPWLHRLATLRDDVIFLIYLYQTWIYRVDYSRINEFGQVGEDDAEVQDKIDDKNASNQKETKKAK